MKRAAIAVGCLVLVGAGLTTRAALRHHYRIVKLPVPGLEGAPAWDVKLTDAMPGPDVVAHPPIVVRDVVVVAGSRVGVAGLRLRDGAELWRRPGGTVAPIAVGPDEV